MSLYNSHGKIIFILEGRGKIFETNSGNPGLGLTLLKCQTKALPRHGSQAGSLAFG